MALPVIGVGFAAVGMDGGAPWFWYVPVGLFVVLSLYGLMLRDAVFVIDDRAMHWQTGERDGRGDGEVALSNVARVVVDDWSDSTDYHIIRTDGRRLTLPPTLDLGPTNRLRDALAAHGIPLDRR